MSGKYMNLIVAVCLNEIELRHYSFFHRMIICFNVQENLVAVTSYSLYFHLNFHCT